jgi:hypothetical protein
MPEAGNRFSTHACLMARSAASVLPPNRASIPRYRSTRYMSGPRRDRVNADGARAELLGGDDREGVRGALRRYVLVAYAGRLSALAVETLMIDAWPISSWRPAPVWWRSRRRGRWVVKSPEVVGGDLLIGPKATVLARGSLGQGTLKAA